MKKLICITGLFLVCFHIQSQKTKYGRYSVEVKQCFTAINITIKENNKTLFNKHIEDVIACNIIDTIAINSDKKPDFIFSYSMEDYTSIGLLISLSQKPYYTFIDLIDIFDPLTYHNIKLKPNEIIKDYIVKNKNIYTNVIVNGNKFYGIPNFSDTITYSKLQEIVKKHIEK